MSLRMSCALITRGPFVLESWCDMNKVDRAKPMIELNGALLACVMALYSR